ncbi:hypothetical protein ACFO4E_15840 [Nocardiopsis mangrovi]|uniref:DNA-binding protein n=1 Tax=Nocardiopsis mangrovi TaxID=1179818 RepID=A0ABV9DWQ9_9ACTN
MGRRDVHTGTPTPSPAHGALADQLAAVAAARLLDPLEILLDGDASVERVRARVAAAAGEWAAALLGADDRAAVHAVARIIAALYPGDTAFDPPAEWWATPLGRTVARRAGHPGAVRVSYAVAGAMLGITRQGVHDLVRRGKLAAHPDGGVHTGSVRARLNGYPARADT